MRTKRILGIMVVSLFLIGLLGACGSRNASDVTPVSDVQDNAVSETVQRNSTGNSAGGNSTRRQKLTRTREAVLSIQFRRNLKLFLRSITRRQISREP